MFIRFITALLFICYTTVFSQYQTESPQTINKNSIQAELKLIYEKGRDAEDTEYSHYTHPSFLLRYGLSSNAELQASLQFCTEHRGKNRVSGFQPIKAGIKMLLNKNENIYPTAALFVGLTIPKLASEEFRLSNIAPEIIFAASKDIKNFSVYTNLGLLWDGETAEPYRYYNLSCTYSPVEYISLFSELFGFLNPKTEADNRLDAGISIFGIKNFQIDFSGGLGLTKSSPDKFFYFGIAYCSSGF